MKAQPEGQGVTFEYVNSVDPATAALIEQHIGGDLMRRGPREMVVENGKLKVVHRTTIEDGLYEPEADYRTQSL